MPMALEAPGQQQQRVPMSSLPLQLTGIGDPRTADCWTDLIVDPVVLISALPDSTRENSDREDM